MVTVLRNEALCDPARRLKGFMENVSQDLIGDNIYNIPVPEDPNPASGRTLHVVEANSKVMLTSDKAGVQDLLMGGVFDESHHSVKRLLPSLEKLRDQVAGSWDPINECFKGGVKEVSRGHTVRESSNAIGNAYVVDQGTHVVHPASKTTPARLYSAQLQLAMCSFIAFVQIAFPGIFEVMEFARAEYNMIGPYGTTTFTQFQQNIGHGGAAGASHNLHTDPNDSGLARTLHIGLNVGGGDGGHVYFPLHNMIYKIKFATMAMFLGLLPHVVTKQSPQNARDFPDAMRISFVVYLSYGAVKNVIFNKEDIWLK